MPFIRLQKAPWQEGHTACGQKKRLVKTKQILDIYCKMAECELAIPVGLVKKLQVKNSRVVDTLIFEAK